MNSTTLADAVYQAALRQCYQEQDGDVVMIWQMGHAVAVGEGTAQADALVYQDCRPRPVAPPAAPEAR